MPEKGFCKSYWNRISLLSDFILYSSEFYYINLVSLCSQDPGLQNDTKLTRRSQKNNDENCKQDPIGFTIFINIPKCSNRILKISLWHSVFNRIFKKHNAKPKIANPG